MGNVRRLTLGKGQSRGFWGAFQKNRRLRRGPSFAPSGSAGEGCIWDFVPDAIMAKYMKKKIILKKSKTIL